MHCKGQFAAVTLLTGAWVAGLAAATPAFSIQTQQFDGHAYKVAEVDLEQMELALYWKTPDGARIGSLAHLDRWLRGEGKSLLFATNAGIFEPDYSPTGLHVEHGVECVALNRKDGRGNFYLKPNGVFFVDAQGAGIAPTEAFHRDSAPLTLATQSGPLLVNSGAIHPRFQKNSKDRNLRSGVGVRSQKQVVFALSRERVTLYEFARFFRDGAACPNALYLDGHLSKFYVPGRDRRAPTRTFAGILAVIEPETKPRTNLPAETPPRGE